MTSALTSVVDSQVHLFPAAARDAAARFGHRVISAKQLVAEMNEAGVARAVLVPPRVPEATNESALEIVERRPDLFGLVARLTGLYDDLPLFFGPHRSSRVLGARVSFPPSGPSPADPQFADLWSAAERAGIPLMAWSPRRLDDLAAIARSHPGLKVAIDHCGLLAEDHGPALIERLAELLPLAELPNISVKASSLPLHSEQPFPFRDMADFTLKIVHAFGPARVFWGSDLSGLHCTYRQCVEMFTENLAELTADDIALIMGDAVTTWLNWSA